MYVQCLGSGDAFGSGGRCNTSFYIRTLTQGVLLDCGASTLTALKREKLSLGDIDIILITHLHGDHFGGLPFVLCEVIALKNRTRPLTIIGPHETKVRTLQGLACFYPGTELTPDVPIAFIEYTTGRALQLERLRVIPHRAVHSPQTNPHALRMEYDGIVVAYSGDTEWTDELITLSDGADLFICEASGYQSPLKHHLTIAKLSEEVHRLRAKKIVLTHPGEEVLRHLHEISFHMANDGEVLLH